MPKLRKTPFKCSVARSANRYMRRIGRTPHPNFLRIEWCCDNNVAVIPVRVPGGRTYATIDTDKCYAEHGRQMRRRMRSRRGASFRGFETNDTTVMYIAGAAVVIGFAAFLYGRAT